MPEMANTPIKFGTDGWRGLIARDFTFANVELCAQAYADYLKVVGLTARGVVIGYDTRFLSEDFAAATAEVLAGNGIKTLLSPSPVPTPVVSYAVMANGASGAVVITASHNPPHWNGFKVKDSAGSSAGGEIIKAIENNIARQNSIKKLGLKTAISQGFVEYRDFSPAYREQLMRLVDLNKLKNAGFRLAVDAMFGAGAGYFKTLIGGENNTIVGINQERNPIFPGMRQPEPIEGNLGALLDRVRQGDIDLGIATDGDADRIGLVDENGHFLNQLQVYALLAFYLLEVRKQRGALVKTITTTSMLYRLGELYDVPVYETPVGFKYVAPAMRKHDAIIGGEESGGYGFRGHVLERDAMVAGLYFLDFMAQTGKKPSELLVWLYEKVGEHYYDRVDATFSTDEGDKIKQRITDALPDIILGVEVAGKDTYDGFRFRLADRSWLLIRFSGTEPLVRFYAEASSNEKVSQLLAFGRELAGV